MGIDGEIQVIKTRIKMLKHGLIDIKAKARKEDRYIELLRQQQAEIVRLEKVVEMYPQLKTSIRKRFEAWNPAGTENPGEYDTYADRLTGMLVNGKNEAMLKSFLTKEFTENTGIEIEESRAKELIEFCYGLIE